MDKKKLVELAKLVRYYILFMTTKAGSGHPTSALSAADLMVALFFAKLRFDLKNPQNPRNDRVIFSKGHVSPLVYALYAAAGVLSEQELATYRKFKSPLEGHPRPNFKYVDVATGSLGQGLSVGVGMALTSKLDKLDNRIYVLMGDSEVSEGSVWEAVELASYYRLDNLIGIIDVNRLGQSGETMLGHDVLAYKKRIEAFGWDAHVIDGHNLDEILEVLEKAGDKPQMIIAKTVKGKGVSFLEDKEGWHGKALGQEDFEKAVEGLGEVNRMLRGEVKKPEIHVKSLSRGERDSKSKVKTAGQKLKVAYKLGDEVATRKAYGAAITKLAEACDDIVCLDAEVKNSTFAEIFKEKFPERYFEMFIAEQNMIGAGLGMAKRGKIPFVSTFAAFLTRAFDQIRMGAYSFGNLKIAGSHAGVSIGEDGPSQMGLEDFAMFRSVFGSVVLCPGDAVACEKLVFEAAGHDGLVYIRTSRPTTPVIYKPDDKFTIGGSRVVIESKEDVLTIVACGIALSESVKAAQKLKAEGICVRVVDAYSIKPIDEEGLVKAAFATGNKIITVEDHYPEGGLGDAVCSVFAKDAKVKIYKLAVSKMPISGKGEELLDFEGISSEAIYLFVKNLLS